jgi:hypothetical protein
MADVIKEFLVSLGFKTDTIGLQSFNGAISGATSTVDGMVKALDDMTKKYESLHYASQRTGATVQSLQAVEYASKRVGMSAGEGAAAMESFAEAMRKNPSIEEGIVGRYGKIQADKAKEFNSFIEGVKNNLGDTKQGYAVALQIAELAGIPEHTLFQIWKNTEKYKKSFEEFKEIYNEGGFNADAFDKKSVQFQDSLERLGVRLDSMKMRFYSGLIDPAQKTVDILDKLAKAVNIQVGKSGEEGGLINGIASLLPDKAAQSFKKGAAEAEKSWKKSEDEYRKGSGNRFLGWWMGWSDEHKEPMKPNISVLPHGMPHRQSMPPQEDENSIRAPSGGTNRRNYVADFFMKRGWSKEHAWAITGTLGGETSNFNPSEGGGWIRGKSGQLHKEDSYGVAQWHKDRRDTFERVFGHPIKGSTLDDQLAFVDWELKNTHKRAGEHIKRTGTPYAGVGVLVPEYEAPADTYGNIRSRGAAAENWFKADLGRRPSVSGWGARTEPAGEQGQADESTRNAKAESPGIVQNNNFTVHMNGITEPDKVRDAMRGGALDWARLSSGWLVKAGDTMR